LRFVAKFSVMSTKQRRTMRSWGGINASNFACADQGDVIREVVDRLPMT